MTCVFLARPASVGEWLEQLNLSRYEQTFLDAGYARRIVCGPMTMSARRSLLSKLKQLTDAELRALGVAHPGHRKRLLLAVRRLDADAVSEASSAPQSTAQSTEGRSARFPEEQEGEEAEAGDRGRLLGRLRIEVQRRVRLLALLVSILSTAHALLRGVYNPLMALLMVSNTFIAVGGSASLLSGLLYVALISFPLLDAIRCTVRLLAVGGANNLIRVLAATVATAQHASTLRPLWRNADGSVLWHAIRRNLGCDISVNLITTNAILYVLHTATPWACASPQYNFMIK